MFGSRSAVVAGIIISIYAALFILTAQVQGDPYDDDEQLHFYWAPASGNVDHYRVFLYIDRVKYSEEWTTRTAPTEQNPFLVPIDAEPGKTYRLQVQAVAADGITTGPPSELSDPVMAVTRKKLYLHNGWNLISLYLDIIDTDISSVLESIEGEGECNSVWTYGYDAGDDFWVWRRYIPGSSSNNLEFIEPGKGYWIDMTGDATLTILGTPITKANIPLYPGWNLVGYSSSIPQPPNGTLPFTLGNYASIWTYDSVTGDWPRYITDAPEYLKFLNTLSLLVPGNGYWVYVKEK